MARGSPQKIKIIQGHHDPEMSHERSSMATGGWRETRKHGFRCWKDSEKKTRAMMRLHDIEIANRTVTPTPSCNPYIIHHYWELRRKYALFIVVTYTIRAKPDAIHIIWFYMVLWWFICSSLIVFTWALATLITMADLLVFSWTSTRQVLELLLGRAVWRWAFGQVGWSPRHSC